MNELWTKVKGWFTQNAQHYCYLEFDDPAAPVPNVVPYQHYFRVWLAEMFLTKSRNWFVDYYPAVNAQIRLTFAGQPGVVFSQMAAPPKELLGPGVFRNYELTRLMPYPGGTVELLTGLLAVQGKSGWGTAVRVLEKFGGLVAPPLGQTLALAREVSVAVSDFMKEANGDVHLGLHQTFSSLGGGGANRFKPGYVALLGAPKSQFPPGQLRVQDDQLYRAGQPLTGVDYMLFRIEARAERDDWQLPNICEPWEKARVAFATGKTDDGKEHKATAIAAAFLSADLTKPDQLRVAKAIKEDLAQVEALGQGAVGQATPDLGQVMESQGMSLDQARTAPRPRLHELLSE